MNRIGSRTFCGCGRTAALVGFHVSACCRGQNYSHRVKRGRAPTGIQWDQGPLRNGSHGYRNAHLRRGCAERECGRSVPRSAAVTHRCCGICRRLRAVALSRPWRTAVGHHTAAPVRTEERARSALALPRFRAAAPSRSWRKRAVHQLPGSFFCGLHLTFYLDLHNKNYIHIFTHTAKTIYIASHSERGRGRPCQRWHD